MAVSSYAYVAFLALYLCKPNAIPTYSRGPLQGYACSMTSSQSTKEAACDRGRIDLGRLHSRHVAGEAAAAAGVTTGGAAAPLGTADAAMAGFTRGVEASLVESTLAILTSLLQSTGFFFFLTQKMPLALCEIQQWFAARRIWVTDADFSVRYNLEETWREFSS